MKAKIILALTLFIMPLNADVNIVVLSGSLRKDSWNKKLAVEAASIAAKKGASVTYIDPSLFPIPFFNEDLESERGMPGNALILRRALVKADSVIIVSPNYNGSMSGVLKNMLDWMSRSEDGNDARDIFRGKKVAIMSASNGKNGGASGLPSLEYVVEKLGGTVTKIKFSLSKAKTKFDESGQLTDFHDKEKLFKAIKEVTDY